MKAIRDHDDLLTALRPNTSLDVLWPDEQRDACLARVLADTAVPVPGRRPRWRRRTALVVLTGLGVFGAGIGVASVFTVWTARGRNGVVCVASGFESAQSAQLPAPTQFDADGATCAPTARSSTRSTRGGLLRGLVVPERAPRRRAGADRLRRSRTTQPPAPAIPQLRCGTTHPHPA